MPGAFRATPFGRNCAEINRCSTPKVGKKRNIAKPRGRTVGHSISIGLILAQKGPPSLQASLQLGPIFLARSSQSEQAPVTCKKHGQLFSTKKLSPLPSDGRSADRWAHPEQLDKAQAGHQPLDGFTSRWTNQHRCVQSV